MNQKKRGTITLVCGIICLVSAVVLLILRLIFGENLVSDTETLLCPLWIVLGVYFCYLSRKMKKKNDH